MLMKQYRLHILQDLLVIFFPIRHFLALICGSGKKGCSCAPFWTDVCGMGACVLWRLDSMVRRSLQGLEPVEGFSQALLCLG